MMSGMDLNLSASYDATPEEVFAIVTDATFREQACEKTKALSYDVTVSVSGEDTVVRVQREMPSKDVPDIARKFVGQTLIVVQTETWHAAAADGSRQADVKGEISGTPVTLKGTAQIIPKGAETVQAIDLNVKVAIPLIGKKIEPFVVDAIRSGLQKEHELGATWHSGNL
jgi:SHS2 domain-containing protein